MKLGPVDFAILAGYFLLILGTGLFFARRAQKTMVDYFLSHRSLPWWLAGTVMVATTFSADTPRAVTEMVTKHGWRETGSGGRCWRRGC
jgi:Na+/proline symporter